MRAARVNLAKSDVVAMTENGTPLVTILTPTYNRADQLVDLWKTLCAQTNRRFCWLVVDDGSTDNTATVVRGLAETSAFEIAYIKKENGGKHTALNCGIAQVSTPLTFIVDSDDALTADAVDAIERAYRAYAEDEDVCGFSFLRAFPDGTVNGGRFPKDEWKETYIRARINQNDMASDKAEVYKTACLREFPFPEFEGERFLGEDIVWIRMARRYKTVHINKVVYIGEYQTDGLTKNRRRHNLSSPNGCTARAREYLQNDIALKPRLKATLQYLIYGRVAKRGYAQLIGQAPNKVACLMLAVPAAVIRTHWLRQYRNND